MGKDSTGLVINKDTLPEIKDEPIKLTDKQELFCNEYLLDLNATQAAIRAGYSQPTSFSIASENLRKPYIRARISELMSKRSESLLIDQEFVIQNLIKVSQRCLQATPVMEFDPIEKKMVQKGANEGEPVWEFDSSGANRSLELIGKHLKMFTDKIENNNNTNIFTGPLSVVINSTGVNIATSEKQVNDTL